MTFSFLLKRVEDIISAFPYGKPSVPLRESTSQTTHDELSECDTGTTRSDGSESWTMPVEEWMSSLQNDTDKCHQELDEVSLELKNVRSVYNSIRTLLGMRYPLPICSENSSGYESIPPVKKLHKMMAEYSAMRRENQEMEAELEHLKAERRELEAGMGI